MEQEQILSNLREGLGQTSLSERTISDFASVLEVPEDETLHGDFFSKQVKILKTVEGQLSHDVATKVEDFKKGYKPEVKTVVEQKETKEDAKKSGAENEAVLKIVKRFVSVEDGDTPISLKNKIVAQYNETYKELYGEGAAPSSSSGGSGNKKASIESTKQYFRQTGRLKETK